MNMLFGYGIRQSNQLQHSFVDFVKTYVETKTLQGAELNARKFSELPSLLLTVPTLIRFPALLKKVLKILNEPIIDSTSHESGVIVKHLACIISRNNQSRDALSINDAYIMNPSISGPSRSARTGILPAYASFVSTDDKTLHDIVMRYKDDSRKLSRALGEYRNEYFAEYSSACRDDRPKEDQKIKCLHHLLIGSVIRF